MGRKWANIVAKKTAKDGANSKAVSYTHLDVYKRQGSSSMSLDSYLFGSIITISAEQVRALFVIAAIVLVLTLLFIRPMYLLTFDEDTAHVDEMCIRDRVRWIQRICITS